MDWSSPVTLLSGAVTTMSGGVGCLFRTSKKERVDVEARYILERKDLQASFLAERKEILEGWEREKQEMRAIQEGQF